MYLSSLVFSILSCRQVGASWSRAIDDYVLSLVSTSVPGELDWRNIQTVLRQSISSVFTLIHSSLLVPTANTQLKTICQFCHKLNDLLYKSISEKYHPLTLSMNLDYKAFVRQPWSHPSSGLCPPHIFVTALLFCCGEM